jgi:branched-chain amino acid transport system permease protein
MMPTMGFTFLFVIFAAVIMGGIGRPLEALLSAFMLGLVIEISGMYLDAAYKQAMAFAILLIILLIRPNGIFAARGRN